MINNEHGFTIIELLLVLLGAVFFTTIGLQSKKLTEQRLLYMAARDIQNIIRQSQDRAYGEQEIYEVVFYTTNGTYAQIRNNRIQQKFETPQGITIESTTFPRKQLYFRRNLTPSTGGTVWLYSKSHKIKITVLPVTGRVKIYTASKR